MISQRDRKRSFMGVSRQRKELAFFLKNKTMERTAEQREKEGKQMRAEDDGGV